MQKNKNLNKPAPPGQIYSAFIESEDMHDLVSEIYEERAESNGKRVLEVIRTLKSKLTVIERRIKGLS